MIWRWIEGVIFAALAIILHLAVFWAQPSATGQTAGGAGGGSTVTMAGASAELTEMIAEWDDAPDVDQTIDKASPDQPDQPDEITAGQMRPPVMKQPTETPQQPPIQSKVTLPIDTPVVSASPAPAPTLQPPIVEAPTVTPPAALDSGLATPTGPTTPKAPQFTSPQIDQSIAEPPEPEVAEIAPGKAPAPDRKPTSPKRKVAKTSPKEPEAQVKPKPTNDLPKKTAEQEATDGNSAEATLASVAAGVGGKAEAGAGQTAKTSNLNAAKKASLEQIWGGQIRRSVERKKRYPRSSRRSGATRIAITVARNGTLIAANISASSGYSGLDKAAISAVKTAAPYSAAPADLTGDKFRFILPVVFKR